MTFDMIDIGWLFIIYAFIGWCVEVSFMAVTAGVFVNRGFLNGPLCPIYGFGVLSVVYILTPYKENVLLLFACSILLTSLLELATGVILEKLFHQRWWDYFDYPLNFKGYICPLMSIVWGIACLLVMYIFHPIIYKFVGIIPNFLSKILLTIIALYIVIDLAATITSILNFNKKLKRINDMGAKFRSSSDELAKSIAETAIEIADRTEEIGESIEAGKLKYEENYKAHMEELRASLPFTQRRILRAFPKMRSNKYDDALQELKSRLLNK